MSKRTIILICFQAIVLTSFACADTLPFTGLNKKRMWLVSGGNAALWTGTYLALNKAWYADYPKSAFHFFNDFPEWNQMDKAGHVWSTYQVSRLSTEMWEWTGLNREKSAVLGVASGMVYQGIIELQDAYSDEWGFSWSDIGSNILGAGVFVLQDMGWKDQRLQVKLSYWPCKYPEELRERRDQLFGASLAERILKDYNSQTYWISGNLSSFFPQSGIPKWLNISVGYGAGGMYGGRSNSWTDKEGTRFDYSSVKRERKFYLSPDIDLTRISTNSKFLRSVFFVLNMVKIPAPALEINNSGKLSFHVLK